MAKVATMARLPGEGGESLQDPLFWTCKIPLSDKSLSLGFFSSFKSGQPYGFQTFGGAAQQLVSKWEAEETCVNPEMVGNKDGEWNMAGKILRWPSTSMWGPVAADHYGRHLSLLLYWWRPVKPQSLFLA